MVTLLLDKGAEVNYRSLYNDWTPLMIAVAEKHVSTAALLIQAGANVNLANERDVRRSCLQRPMEVYP